MEDDTAHPVHNAYHLLCSVMDGQGEGILTSVSPEGRPHATWMATMTSLNFRNLLTLTSPDSHKVENVRANPEVEWLFNDDEKRRLVYLVGRARVVDDVHSIKHAWELIPDKQRAFFLDHYNSGPGYAVIETVVEKVLYAVPAENFFEQIDPLELSAMEQADSQGG